MKEAVDTNLLVYAFDATDPVKYATCRKLFLETFGGKRKLAVTNQILAELAYALTKRLKKPLTKEQASDIVLSILLNENWEKVNYSVETVVNAVASSNPFWDALIAQTLKEHGIQKIFTENKKDFSDSGLEAINPFEG